jgi:hypothetical protein
VLVVIVAALVGCLVTALSRAEPGTTLGALVIGGTLAAGAVVRARAAYLVIPVPAPAYALAAIAAGVVHDRAAHASRTTMAVHAVQWLSSGFTAMAAATALAVVVAAARWAVSRYARTRRRPAHTGGDDSLPTSRQAARTAESESAARGSDDWPSAGW